MLKIISANFRKLNSLHVESDATSHQDSGHGEKLIFLSIILTGLNSNKVT